MSLSIIHLPHDVFLLIFINLQPEDFLALVQVQTRVALLRIKSL